ncbi:unnamed protein product [Acidithrix sp. C25]|nr:unnamed protein product [Acidithrix sp. C25]
MELFSDQIALGKTGELISSFSFQRWVLWLMLGFSAALA